MRGPGLHGTVRFMPNDYFDEPIAAAYDADSADLFDPAIVGPAVGFLAELVGDGRALEFGIGTGRIALPLSQRGIPVHGIDLSHAMVERLRTKPGGEALAVTIGDFARTRVEGGSGSSTSSTTGSAI